MNVFFSCSPTLRVVLALSLVTSISRCKSLITENLEVMAELLIVNSGIDTEDSFKGRSPYTTHVEVRSTVISQGVIRMDASAYGITGKLRCVKCRQKSPEVYELAATCHKDETSTG